MSRLTVAGIIHVQTFGKATWILESFLFGSVLSFRYSVDLYIKIDPIHHLTLKTLHVHETSLVLLFFTNLSIVEIRIIEYQSLKTGEHTALRHP